LEWLDYAVGSLFWFVKEVTLNAPEMLPLVPQPQKKLASLVKARRDLLSSGKVT